MFSHSEFNAFRDQQVPYKLCDPSAVAAPFKPLMDHPVWRGPAHLPSPLEFDTRPGDMVYLPRGTVHATWKRGDFTMGLVDIKEED